MYDFTIHVLRIVKARPIILGTLFLIYNKTLQSGKLPSDWKLAEVTAIYKKAQNQIQEIIDL